MVRSSLDTPSPQRPTQRLFGPLTLVVTALAVFVAMGARAQDRGLEHEFDSEDAALDRTAWLYVVGIDDYQHSEIPDLATAVNDARALRDLLIEHYQFSPDRLVERYNAEATREQIHADLRNLAERLEEGDSLLIYYAGHGYEDAILDQGYWIPVDGYPPTSTASWISNSEIRTYLKSIEARHIWLISDSCFSGTLLGQRVLKEDPGDGDWVYRKVFRDKSRQVLTSGGDEPVADGGYDGHSVFASHLLHYLEQPRGQYLMASEVAVQIKTVVGNDAFQTPQFGPLREVGDQMGEFVLVARDFAAPQPLGEAAVEVRTGDVIDIQGAAETLQQTLQLRAEAEAALLAEAEADWAAITPLLDTAGPEARVAAELYLRKYGDASIVVGGGDAAVVVPHLEDARRELESPPTAEQSSSFADPPSDGFPPPNTGSDPRAKKTEVGAGPARASLPPQPVSDIRAQVARLQAQRLDRERHEQAVQAARAEAEARILAGWTQVVGAAGAGGPAGEQALLAFLAEYGEAITVRVGQEDLIVQVPQATEAVARLADFDYSIGFNSPMVRVQPGRFQMGSPPTEPNRGSDEREHEVTITAPYLLGITEVRQDLYDRVMGDNPSQYSDDDNPVEKVTWYDAVEFCNRLSTLEGYEPAYRIVGDRVTWKRSANGYRLPTEAEWEYAARAGEDTLYAGSNDADQVAWYGRRKPADVAQKRSNAWGFYDMSGNVREWVWDGYGDYDVGPVSDPSGSSATEERVNRGGSWDASPATVRLANRSRWRPDGKSSNLGFRVARTLPR